jgi:hypothetical protein
MNPVLKKMLFKEHSPVLVVDPPPEARTLVKAFGVPVHSRPSGRYGFMLGFAKSLADADGVGKAAAEALEDGALLWMAYPKGTSKKYPKVDINRDTSNARMGRWGFEVVSIVAIDDDWAAVRLRPKTR